MTEGRKTKSNMSLEKITKRTQLAASQTRFLYENFEKKEIPQ